MITGTGLEDSINGLGSLEMGPVGPERAAGWSQMGSEYIVKKIFSAKVQFLT